MGASAWGLMQEIPFIDEASRLGRLSTQSGKESFLHDTVKSTVIPAGVDWAARMGDLNNKGEPRKVKTDTLTDALQSGIPGMRNKLQTKQQR